MALQLHVVYGITQHKYNSVAYIGSSMRDSKRESEHTNLASGARRVVTTFAQKWHQPVNEHFETNTLWMGECTPAQAKSIEQVFMDRHETRIFPRPTNGVTVDIDLLQPPTGRLQLNVVRSCTDPELIDWAEKRIFNDTALAEAPSARDMAVAHHLVEMEMLSLTEAVDDTASTVVERAIAKFGGFDPDEPVSVTDFHSTLNEVLGTLCDDDGADARSAVLSKVAYFNADKRGSGFTCRAAMVEAEFAALRVALGHNKRKTESGSETGEKKQRAVDAPDTRAVNPETGSRMTRTFYESFVRVRTITKNAKRKTPGSDTANYVCFACPHCKFEVEVPETCVQRRKSSECKAHLAICPVLTESRNEAERKEAKQRHDQLISQLTERSEQLSGIQDQLTDVQQQLSDKRQCLADVREWASLKEPDSTLVPQLACREMKLLGPLKSEVETLKTVNSVLNERSPVALMQRAIEAENRAQKAESALLLEKQRAQKLNVASS